MNGTLPVRVVGPLLWRQALERLIAGLPNVCVTSVPPETADGSVSVLLGLHSVDVQDYLGRYGSERCILVTNETAMRAPLFQQSHVAVFVGEQEEAPVLWDAVQRAARNEAYCSPSLIAALISTAQSAPGQAEGLTASLSPLLARLSLREREVVSYALEGWSNDQIAGHLHISVATVKFHLFRAYRKLGISGRTELRGAIARQKTLNTKQTNL